MVFPYTTRVGLLYHYWWVYRPQPRVASGAEIRTATSLPLLFVFMLRNRRNHDFFPTEDLGIYGKSAGAN
jgi:hypothetical protein